MNARILRPLLAASLVLAFSLAVRAADTASAANGKKVNINQASAEELARLPRVGAKAAQRVVDYRKARGPFARPEDLMEVKGFGEKKFEQLKPYLAVSGPTTLDAKVSSAGSRGGRSKSAAKPASQKASSRKASAHSAPVGQER
ncbi:MAG: ComEA family DNA-binding protein [Thermoanaerobaculia bacterium]